MYVTVRHTIPVLQHCIKPMLAVSLSLPDLPVNPGGWPLSSDDSLTHSLDSLTHLARASA